MQELRFLRFARRLLLIDIYMKFREDSLNGFSSYIERERFCDKQTDRHPGEKYMSPNPKMGENNNINNNNK